MVDMVKNKVFMVLVLLSFLLFSVNAQEIKTQNERTLNITDLIEKDLYKNHDAISSIAQGMTYDQKEFIFTQYKKETTVPFIMNMIIGFGSGSYVQGDIRNGVIASCGDSLSLLFLVASYSAYSDACVRYKEAEDDIDAAYGMENAKESMDANAGIMLLSGVSLLAFKVYECICPYVYANKYNRTLSKALNLYGITYNLTPSIDTDGTIELALACKKSL